MWGLYTSEIEAAFAAVALTIGAAVLASFALDRHRVAHRVVLFAVAQVLGLRYLYWRATDTLTPFDLSLSWLFSWAFFAVEAAALISSLSAFTLLMGWRSRSEEADIHAAWWRPAPAPKVAILIATYNEEQGVLARTIAGAKALDHPDIAVYVLDDGRRDWLAAYCAEQEVHYLRRPDNKGSKAGNINHALERLRELPRQPDFVAVLDADFVPHRNFLQRTLALFHEADVGLVQTPQHFFNPDPIQHNLGLSRSYPDEQRFFFDHLQPSRDAWGIAFCCGTSSVVRGAALEAVGGFPTESVTEDFLLTLVLQERGWRSVYLNEPLTEGLAPEGLKEYVTQRARWCLGLMQISRGRCGPFTTAKLRLRDRWSVVDSMLYWITSYPFRVAALTFPLLYWYFNITVVDASVPEVIAYFGTYFLWTLFILNFISGGLVVPAVNDVSQLLAALPIIRASTVGLLRPHGHPFSVTAKGGDRTKVIVQWRLMAPYLILIGLTVVGLLLGIVSDRFAYNDAADGKVIVLFWSLYNLFVLAIACMVCVELPRVEHHLADKPERSLMRIQQKLHRVWVTELSQGTARVRGVDLAAGDEVLIGLRDIGNVRAFVLEATPDGGMLSLDLSSGQFEALLRRLYAEGGAPGVTQSRLWIVMRDLFLSRFYR